MNNEHYLHYVGDDDLEAADDHRLGGGDPADGLGHEDAAEDAEDCLLEAEQPGHPGPAAEQRHGVQTGHAHHGDGEPAHREPEHEDGVVEVAQLPRDDRHPGRQQRHRQREPEPHQVVRSLGHPGPRVPRLGHRHVGGVGGGGGGEEGGGARDDDHAAQQTRADQSPGAARVTCHSTLVSSPVHAAVVLQQEGGQQQRDGRRGEEDGGAVADGQPLDSLEYGEQQEAAHHGLGRQPPARAEVGGGEEAGAGPAHQRHHHRALAHAAHQQHLPGAHADVDTRELDADVAADMLGSGRGHERRVTLPGGEAEARNNGEDVSETDVGGGGGLLASYGLGAASLAAG